MAPLSDNEIDAAEARGREFAAYAPRAAAARFDRERSVVSIELVNGCTFSFPTDLIEDLRGAKQEDLNRIGIDGAGFNLHWPNLDIDLFVPALLAGVFGTKRFMARELARIAGRATSPAKAAAARRNGAKGGRPRKTAAS
jgi:hypothetical protein